MHRRPEFHQRFAVVLRAVAHIAVPAVFREFLVKPHHQAISIILRQYGGAGYAQEFAVALHDALVRDEIVRVEAVAVHQDEFRLGVQVLQGQVHSVDAGVQDVVAVDGFHANFRDGKCKAMLPDILVDFQPLFRAEHFGIRDVARLELRAEDHACSDHRPAKAASAYLITACLQIFLRKPPPQSHRAKIGDNG